VNRELEEESGVTAASLRQIGLLIFEFIGEAQLLEVHVFSTDEFSGTVIETEGRLVIQEFFAEQKKRLASLQRKQLLVMFSLRRVMQCGGRAHRAIL